MRRLSLAAFFLLLGCLAPHTLHSQAPSDPLTRNLPWRAIGPAVMGGRIDDVAIVEQNPSVIFVGAASGGVWKSTNKGTTWEPIFDDQGTASIGDIAVSSTSPDLVWVGTGEPNNRQSSSFGDGVYKSTDGGRTWSHMGLRDTQHIGRVLIDPVDNDIVYVAALGRLWGPNTERGLFKTTDGGRTWTNTNFVNEDTGFVDLVMDPSNRQVLYAAAYQRRRVPWGFNGGGPGGAIYKTADGGRSWRKLTTGLPQGIIGRIGLDVYRRNPKVVYATVEHKEGGTFRSEDGGETWQKMSGMNPRPMYYSKIRIDPNNDRRIYVLGASFFVSTDGGRTFADPRTGRSGANSSMSSSYDVGVHGDHHTLWIDPANSNHLVLGNDGGLYFSYDGSVSWDKVNNIPLAQFYGIGVDMEQPYNIYAGAQDTHSWGGPSATRHQVGITNADWFQTNFGDGMYAQPDPSDPDIIYTEAQDGTLVRFHRPTGDRKWIRPWAPAGEPPYRFNWTTPFLVSPHDSRTLYIGGNRVFRSTDRGDTWVAGPDLTRAENRDTLPIMGVLPSAEMLSRGDGVSSWGTITTLAESPVTAGVLWAGTDDGYVQVSRNSGKTWTNVTSRMPGPERKGRISRVAPSPREAGTVYVSLDRHESDDFAPYIFVSPDYGQTWRSITGSLPKVGWVNVVKEHPTNPRLLFAGTEVSLFFSTDAGTTWTRFSGFPTVPVDDLLVHPRDNDLVVGTHGRAIYVLDDVVALSGFTPDVQRADAHLFEPRAATIMQLWKNESYAAQRVFAGPNPPRGAILNYHLKSAAETDVKLTIADAQGTTVRELAGTKDVGINRVVWDLRAAAPPNVGGVRAPFVLPGTYTVTLTIGARTSSRSLEVKADPLFPSSDAERQARFAFLSSLNEMQAAAQRGVTTLTALNNQMNALEEQLKKTPDVPATVRTAFDAALKEARDLRARLTGATGDGDAGGEGGGPPTNVRARLAMLLGEIDGAGVQQGTLGGPTPSQLARRDEVASALKDVEARLQTMMSSTIPKLNDEMNRANIPRIVGA